MSPIAFLALTSGTLPRVELPAPNELVLRLDSKTVFRAFLNEDSRAVDASEESLPASALYLGYPHGPKTADWEPTDASKESLILRFSAPLRAEIDAGIHSFACTDDPNSPLGSSFGNADSGLNKAVYCRSGDWLITADGGQPHVQFEGAGKYVLATGGPCRIHFRARYYADHLGYFLWDRAKPLWKAPVAGWCSWAAYGQDINGSKALAAAKFFSRNLKDYGYHVIQIDDGYQRVLQNRAENHINEPFAHYWSIPNGKFPDGLVALAHAIDRLGMTPGIWVGLYLPLGLQHAEGYVKDPDGKPHAGPWVGYAMNGLDAGAREEAYIETVRELRAEGWRYFKIDTLRHILYDSYRKVPQYWNDRRESMEEAYRKILQEVKKAAGANSYLLACWGTIPELAGIPDGCRIGEDVGPDLDSMRRTAKYIAQFHYLNNVVWRNDPDYMCLRLPIDQARAWLTMNFMAGGNLMASDPPEDYDDARLDALRKAGPPLYLHPSGVVSHAPDPEFMTLTCRKGNESWEVVSRFAWGALPGKQITLSDLGLDPKRSYLAFDFWSEEFRGVVRGTFAFSALTAGQCQVISFRPLLSHPQVLGTDRHLSQGAYELEDVKWNGSRLSGKFLGGRGRDWTLYLYMPPDWQIESTPEARVKGNVVALPIPGRKAEVSWHADFGR